MTHDDHKTVQARARRAGFLYLFVNALYIASLLATMAGPEELRRPAIAIMACATAATIAMAWAFYELLKPVDQGLALLALLFRVAEAALFGVIVIFTLNLLNAAAAGAPDLDDSGPALMRNARSAGQIAQVYFCAGSAIFFYLLLKGRVIPRAIAAFGLITTIVIFVSGLAQIIAPPLARYAAFVDPILLAAETVTGVWLLVFGAAPRRRPLADASPSTG